MLELAGDERLPLLERVRFFAIFSMNLDEFFRVRVAGLMDQLDAGYTRKLADGRTVRPTLADIRHRVVELENAQSKLWLDDLKPELARRASSSARSTTARPTSSRSSAAASATGGVPGAHAARHRPGAVVSVHLSAVA